MAAADTAEEMRKDSARPRRGHEEVAVAIAERGEADEALGMTVRREGEEVGDGGAGGDWRRRRWRRRSVAVGVGAQRPRRLGALGRAEQSNDTRVGIRVFIKQPRPIIYLFIHSLI